MKTLLNLLGQFFKYFLQTLIPFLPLILILAVILFIVYILLNSIYKSGKYYRITKVPLLNLAHDAGRIGEFLIYLELKFLEKSGAEFLFNVYIPKENGETSEIDVLMLCPKGIFVFESKNYSGWIFGSENKKNWYQTLPRGRGKSRKEMFYNPIMQNRSHIKHLKALIGEKFPMHSVIVFSNRCTLKSLTFTSNDIKVINRSDVVSSVSETCSSVPEEILSAEQITELYKQLYPYTQVSESEKLKHIENIKNLHKTASTASENIKNTKPDSPTFSDTELSAVSPVQSSIETAYASDTGDIADIDIFHGTSDKTQADTATAIDFTQHIENNICPKCGGELVLRTTSRGTNKGKSFWGCKNYPKCKYTENAE